MSHQYDHKKEESSELNSSQSLLQPKLKPLLQPKLVPLLKPMQFKTASKMPEEVQAKMENSFGEDFSDVAIHDNSAQAEDLGAKAFAQGKDVHFAPGEFQPNTKQGQELIGHELTHVVQQKDGKVHGSEVHGKDMVNQDPALEKEADDAGKLASEGKSVEVKGGAINSTVQMFEAPGHEAAERTALTEGDKFSNDEASMVYFGNWMRDTNQALVPALGDALGADGVFALIKLLAVKKFGRELTPEQFGFYIPSEHIDNPGGQIAGMDYYKSQPSISKDIANDGTDDRFKTLNFKPRDTDMVTPQEDTNPATAKVLGTPIFSVDQTGMLAYIRRTNLHVEDRLTLAAERGRNADGMMHFGAALHAIEDLFAHSNFVEIALNKVLEFDPNVLSEQPLLPELKGADRKVQTLSSSVNVNGKSRPVLTTGTFTSMDTMESVGSEAVKMLREGMQPAKDDAELEAQAAVMSAMLHKLDKLKSSTQAKKLIKDAAAQLPVGGDTVNDLVQNNDIGGAYDFMRKLPKVPGLRLFKFIHNGMVSIVNSTVLPPVAETVEAHTLTAKVQDTPLFKGDADNKAIVDSGGKKTTPMQDLTAELTGNPVDTAKNLAEAQARRTAFHATPYKVQANASHSQLAKDHSNSIFNGLAFKLAVEADKMLRDKMIAAWNDTSKEVDPDTTDREKYEKYEKEYDANKWKPDLLKKDPADNVQRSRIRDKAQNESLEYGKSVYSNGHKEGQEFDLDEMRNSSAQHVFMISETIRSIAEAPSNASIGIQNLQKFLGAKKIESAFATKTLNKALETTEGLDSSITKNELKEKMIFCAKKMKETSILIRNSKNLKEREAAYNELLNCKIELIRIVKMDIKTNSFGSTAIYSPLIVMLDREMAVVAPAYTSEQLTRLNDSSPNKALVSSMVKLPELTSARIAARPGLKALLETSRMIINHPFESTWWKQHVVDFANQHSKQLMEEIKARNAGYTNMGGEHKH
ncbi:MAG: DUF4157 domain-containing protein [Cytophagaceae bacterium]|jgi:hypothetical protein|nr:DUF4157 domain-containing protein [Cytophagaceae bacterium]